MDEYEREDIERRRPADDGDGPGNEDVVLATQWQRPDGGCVENKINKGARPTLSFKPRCEVQVHGRMVHRRGEAAASLDTGRDSLAESPLLL